MFLKHAFANIISLRTEGRIAKISENPARCRQGRVDTHNQHEQTMAAASTERSRAAASGTARWRQHPPAPRSLQGGRASTLGRRRGLETPRRGLAAPSAAAACRAMGADQVQGIDAVGGGAVASEQLRPVHLESLPHRRRRSAASASEERRKRDFGGSDYRFAATARCQSKGLQNNLEFGPAC